MRDECINLTKLFTATSFILLCKKMHIEKTKSSQEKADIYYKMIC